MAIESEVMSSNDMEKSWTSFCQFESCKRDEALHSLTEFMELWQLRLKEVQSYGLNYCDYVLALKLVYSCQLEEQVEKSALRMLYTNKDSTDDNLLQTMIFLHKLTNSDSEELMEGGGVDILLNEAVIKQELENLEENDLPDNIDDVYDEFIPKTDSKTDLIDDKTVRSATELESLAMARENAKETCPICNKKVLYLSSHVAYNHKDQKDTVKIAYKKSKITLDNDAFDKLTDVKKDLDDFESALDTKDPDFIPPENFHEPSNDSLVKEESNISRENENWRQNEDDTSKTILSVICHSCGIDLPSAPAYIKHIYKCKELKKTSLLGDKAKGSDYEDMEHDEESDVGQQLETKLTCSLCNKTFEDAYKLKSHIKDVHDKKFQCPICGMKFPREKQFKHHIEIKHNQQEGKDLEGKKEDTSMYTCDLCDKSFQGSYKFKAHVKDVHNKKYQCPVCGMKFPRIKPFQRHIFIKHQKADGKEGGEEGTAGGGDGDEPLKEEDLQCEQCGKKLENAKKMLLHERLHYQFICKPCGHRRFKTQEDLDRHILKHKEIPCSNCNQVFPSNKAYDHHMGSGPCSRIEQIACEICGKLCSNKQNLSHHKQIHKSIQFVCEKPGCGKTFRVKENYKQHIRRHEGIKNYKCDHCHMAFVSRASLTVHIDRHLGNRRHTCKECGKSFYTSDNLKTHMRSHTGAKPYQCDECDKSFGRNWNLKKHKRSAHGA
eukprot:TRINITY_DN5555_c0_g1_i5.p1 TRINITY_DN5555_c0_g1~~TRINITY_DN5555_c0_g1_i5.p1  ORF type:complete len:718 (-),score=101.24 TRINITY_DN5555_c0_g1_i5:127-2280(-)